MNTQRPAVFFDRDGVLNRAIVRNGKPYPPATLQELEILPGVPEALRLLQQAGFLLLGATNQPDVARGRQTREVVQAINAALLEALPLREILVCYHDDADGCACRKPGAGLLLEAAARYNLALASSFMVGDRSKDIEAGRRAGCTTLFIDYGYSETGHSTQPHWTGRSLQDAAAWILSQWETKTRMQWNH